MLAVERLLVDLDDVERAAGREEQRDHADEQAHVAHAVGDERLEGGVAVRLLLPPVPDEHERADAHQLPADDELQGRLGHDQAEHRRREQGQEGEEVRVAPIAGHVVGRVDVHEQRHERDDEQHHHGRAVEQHADLDVDAAVLEPGPRLLYGCDRRELLPRRRAPRPRPRCASSLAPGRRGDSPSTATAPRPCSCLVGRCLSSVCVSAVGRGSSTWSNHWTLMTIASTKAMPTAATPISLPLPRQALAEEQDEEERRRGDERDDPGVVEHVPISPSSSRPRRGRRSTGCGR